MTREELIQSKEYWIAKLQIDLFNEVEDYMHKNKLTRTQFAEKLGVSKGYISQILNGDADHRMSKLVELSLAIGLLPNISYEKTDDLLKREENGCFNVTLSDIEQSKEILLKSGFLTSHKAVSYKETSSDTSESSSKWTILHYNDNPEKLNQTAQAS
jgi:transcriptional regulator with XRE-family HTH domain